ncbi:cytochrome P450 [Streptomyces niveiscabiei]|uniref:cytochrome P450 n=1 Tax=Streptomyces niveiscabiei TaxID=164115 RepID=UPI0029B335E4|nr:cytochrome P450 [Streptomyces niveiscabiei]MDX3386048.1 cytochrome P450 [Streptomyces niveiscabiei]
MRTARQAAAVLLDTGPPPDTDPYPLYRALHEAGPLLLGDNLVVLSRYTDCRRALAHPALAQRDAYWQRHHAAAVPGAAQQLMITSVMHADGARHRRLRQAFTPDFTVRACRARQSRLERLVDRYVDAVAEAGDHGRRAVDAVPVLAQPLPVDVLGEILAIPSPDRPMLARWVAEFLPAVDWPGVATPAADRATDRLHDYMRQLAADRSHPAGRVSELPLHLAFLLIAGAYTTTNLIASGLATLAGRPDLWSRLAHHPDAYVTEILRTTPPARVTSRYARGPVDLGTVTVPDGALVLIMLEAGQYDALHVPHPDRFLPGRRPSPALLAFGAGPHYCLGAPLARQTATTLFTALATRFPRLRPAGPPTGSGSAVRGGHRAVPLLFGTG